MIKKIHFINSYNPEEVERFLEEQAANGYMFVKKKGIFFYFEKCEPKKVRFLTRLELITAAEISYYEVDGWKYCGLNGSMHIFYSENADAKPVRAEMPERYKSIKYNALKKECIKWILNLIIFIGLFILVLNCVNRAELMIKHFYLIFIASGWVIYIVADIVGYIVFCVRNSRNVKKDRELCFFSKKNVIAHGICKGLIVVMTLTIAFVVRGMYWENDTEIYFGYKDIGIGVSGTQNVDTESCTYSSVYGEIINWSETIYRGDGGKTIKLGFEILKSENKEVVASYLSVSNDEDWKDVSMKWRLFWNANQVYYRFEENDVRREEWLVVYDEMILKVTVDNTNIYEDIIKKIATKIDLYYGSMTELKDGVYYPAINEALIYDDSPDNPQGFCFMEYKGKIYEAYSGEIATVDAGEEERNKVLEEIGKVYKTQAGHYSDSYEKIGKVVGEEKIYKIKGYDEDFRIAIYNEYDNEDGGKGYELQIFHCLNDIVLNYGKELFEDRLHLSKSTELFGSTNLIERDECDIGMEYEMVRDFLSALNDGVFLSSEYEQYPDLEKKYSYNLRFVDENGINVNLTLYSEGYVVMPNGNMEDLIVKVDVSACSEIISTILYSN